MKKLIVRSIAASVLGGVFSLAALAQEVPFHGAMVDPANVPRDVSPMPTVVNPPGNAPEQGGTPRAFGPTLWSVYNVGPCDATARITSAPLDNTNCQYVKASSAGSAILGFPVHLPGGAVMSFARVYFNQTVASNPISAGLHKFDQFGNLTQIVGMSPAATTAGNTVAEFGPFSEVVNNAPSSGYTYNFLAIFGGTTKIYKMTVYYKLQVSPAPASASFTDVPTGHWAFQFIQALRSSGITTGCTATTYCPDASVTRAEMAVFMSRALGLAFEF